MQYPSSPFEQLRQFFSRRTVLSTLTWINIAVFILANLFSLALWLFKSPAIINESGISVFSYWFGVPAHLPQLLYKPWTLLSYMFVQESFFHLLFNMIVLYFGGLIFMQQMGEKRLLLTYLLGGISGAAFFILAYNIFPVFNDALPNAIAIGSSAAVLGILVAAATFAPDYTVSLLFIGKAKLKYIALVLVLMDVLSIQRSNPGGHLAHLGGAFWGFVSIQFLIRMLPKFKKMKGFQFSGLFRWFKKKHSPDFTNLRGEGRPLTDDKYNEIRAERQARIDVILEKISKSGYDALTKEEKELLFDASNRK